MDVPTKDVDLEGTVVVDAPWGRARFSPRHACFVRVLAVPAPIALHPPGPRVLGSSSTWVAVEDTIGVTAAALFATVGVDAVDVGLRRRIWQVATMGNHAVPRTDQIWLGFDGHIVITVPPTTGGDGNGDDDGRGLLALALDVDPAARTREQRDGAGSDKEDRRALAALLAKVFPTEARAFDGARARGHLAGPPVAPTPPTPSAAPAAATTATTAAPASPHLMVAALARLEALARLRALPERPLSIPPTGFIALPAVIDGDDDRAWEVWRPASTQPKPPTAAEQAILNDPARRRRIAAAFAHVLVALGASAPDFVSMGAPHDVRLTRDGCVFHDDQKRRAAAPAGDDSRTAPFHFRYVPPEQAVGASLDIRASLYVVGVHLYEALAGRHPYWSESAVGFAFQHARKAPPPLVELNPGVHAGLAAVALRLLQKKAADRYAHPGEVVVALARAIEQGC